MDTDLHSDLTELWADAHVSEFLKQLATDTSDPDPDIRRVMLETTLSQMTPREEKAIRMLYGLDNEKKHTQQEVAAALGISCEHVRMIIARFKHRFGCRQHRPKKLKDYFD